MIATFSSIIFSSHVCQVYNDPCVDEIQLVFHLLKTTVLKLHGGSTDVDFSYEWYKQYFKKWAQRVNN